MGDTGFLRDKAAVLWYVITDALCALCIIKYYMEEHRNSYSSPLTVRGHQIKEGVRRIGPCDTHGGEETCLLGFCWKT
jgi:hypothetical protein